MSDEIAWNQKMAYGLYAPMTIHTLEIPLGDGSIKVTGSPRHVKVIQRWLAWRIRHGADTTVEQLEAACERLDA